MNSRTANDRYILRAAWQPQVIFSVMLGGGALVVAAKGIYMHRTDLLHLAAILGCGWAAYIAWFRSFALEVDENSLTYSALFARRKTIPLTDIRSINFRRIALGSKLRSTGYQSIIIELKGDSASSVVMNARVFPEEGLKTIFNNLASRGIPVNK